LAGHLRHGFALAVAVAAALSLAACGRKGGLELPPGPGTQPPVAAAPPTSSSGFLPATSSAQTAQTQQQEDALAQKNGFDSHGRPVAAQGTNRPFILDPILQ
jgi:predicted small lipoprotein YifL